VVDVQSFFENLFTVKTEKAALWRRVMEGNLNKLIEDVFGSIKSGMDNAVKYYEKIEGAVYKNKLKTLVEMKIDTSDHGMTEGGFASAMASATMKIIPVLGLIFMAMEKDMLKDELLGILKKYTDTIKQKIHKQHSTALQILDGRPL
jgi:DNA-binding transcriptional regulator YbjK